MAGFRKRTLINLYTSFAAMFAGFVEEEAHARPRFLDAVTYYVQGQLAQTWQRASGVVVGYLRYTFARKPSHEHPQPHCSRHNHSHNAQYTSRVTQVTQCQRETSVSLRNINPLTNPITYLTL